MDIEQTIRDYLPATIHLSLATSRDNRPWVCEVHFAYDDQLNLYFRSLLARRHSQEILANPNVSGNMVTQHELNQKVRAVYFEGTAQLLESDEGIRPAFEALSQRLHVGTAVLEEATRDDGHKFFKINVSKFYIFDGREVSPAQKYELNWHL